MQFFREAHFSNWKAQFFYNGSKSRTKVDASFSKRFYRMKMIEYLTTNIKFTYLGALTIHLRCLINQLIQFSLNTNLLRFLLKKTFPNLFSVCVLRAAM